MKINNLLFEKAFEISLWKNEDKIAELISHLESIERTIKKYLELISDDFPFLTDHTITHSHKLWDYASLIVGDKERFLNPLEGFILHSVFLVHDAGMCYSILNNHKEIVEDPVYIDFIARNGSSVEAKEEALFFAVRQKHGDFAERIATDKLSEEDYLISDTLLREELGLIIGKIAKSHTCDISYIERELASEYTTPKFPVEWSINPQKLCFLLRTADAAHIDNLRTPKTNRMIKEIKGSSQDHWTFQKKLGFPHLSNDELLVYSTNRPFKSKEQKAWWFCYEALLVLDRELKNANQYFSTNNYIGFKAKGVKSISDTLLLGQKYIRTEGWNSVNTKIKVSDPIKIAMELGGVKLYGTKNIAIRELIQNSIDSINLYRIFNDQENFDVGEITLSMQELDGNYYLTITDNGIGMSQTTLTTELLDFGGSYWKSSRFQYDFKETNTSKFESIGKFGIGFFSTFMLGNKVTVTSWKFGDSITNMKTLDFYDGLLSNPILREATQEEKKAVVNRGTSIKIKLNENPYLKNGCIGQLKFTANNLYSLVKYFVPSSNVKIKVEELDNFSHTIDANIIDKLTFNQLIDHLYIEGEEKEVTDQIEFLKTLNLKLFEVSDKGKFYGKIALMPNSGKYNISSLSVILSNGIRVSDISNDIIGYIVSDEVVSIKRDKSTSAIPYETLRNWAKLQKQFIEANSSRKIQYHKIYSDLLLTFNFFDENYPVTLKKENNHYAYVSIASFRKFLNKNDTVKFHTENYVPSLRAANCDGFISTNNGLNLLNLVKESDHHKLITHENLISDIITEQWGKFEKSYEEDQAWSPIHSDQPYRTIVIYKRI